MGTLHCAQNSPNNKRSKSNNLSSGIMMVNISPNKVIHEAQLVFGSVQMHNSMSQLHFYPNLRWNYLCKRPTRVL